MSDVVEENYEALQDAINKQPVEAARRVTKEAMENDA
jgi:hypothetical protein